jgi:predicted RNA binding protein YcfA (HicA-like mRNA interferase family)
MPEYPVAKPKEVLKALERVGFMTVRTKGSHTQLKKGNLLVTVPVHNHDLTITTLKSIIRQSGLTPEDFIRLLK